MANFICPFSKKVCNPSCEHWEFEKTTTKTLMGIIPLNFSVKGILMSGLFMNNMPMPITYILNEYRKHYDLFHPEQTTTPRGRCLKIEKLNEEHLTTEETV
jgi:hypothetical protein